MLPDLARWAHAIHTTAPGDQQWAIGPSMTTPTISTSN